MVCLFRIKVKSACFLHLSSHSVLLLEDISVSLLWNFCQSMGSSSHLQQNSNSCRCHFTKRSNQTKYHWVQDYDGYFEHTEGCLGTSANVVYCTPRLTFSHSHAVSLLFLFSSAFPLKLTPLVVSSVFISEKGKLGCILSSGHFTALFRFSIGCFFIIPKWLFLLGGSSYPPSISIETGDGHKWGFMQLAAVIVWKSSSWVELKS